MNYVSHTCRWAALKFLALLVLLVRKYSFLWRWLWRQLGEGCEVCVEHQCWSIRGRDFVPLWHIQHPKVSRGGKGSGYICVVAVEINSIIRTNTKVLYERKACSALSDRNLVLPVFWVTGQLRGLAAQAFFPDVRNTEVQQVHKSVLLPSLKFLAGTCLLSSGLFSTGHLPGEQRFAWFSPIVCSHSQSVYLWALLAVKTRRSACPYHLDLKRQLMAWPLSCSL